MAGIVSSSTAFLLLLVLMPKNGSEALAAEMCYCYQRSAVDGETNKLTKTIALLSVGPIELQIKKTISPVSGCSSAVPTPSKPPPIPADTRAPTPRAPAASDKRGLSWRAQAWCCLGLTVAIVIVVFAAVRPETFIVPSRMDPLLTAGGEGDSPVDGNEHTTMVRVAAQVPTGSREPRRERRSRRMPRPQLQETLIIDSNGNSRLDTNTGDGNEDSSADGNDVGDGKRFYCAKCMHVVPCACIRRSFTSCAHDFCSSCVSRRLQARRGDGGKHFYCTKCMHVVPCACIRPSFTSCAHDFCSSCVARPTSQAQGLRRRAGKMPQHQPPVDMLLLTEGNGDSPVDGHGELFDCAICMETVPGALKFIINSCGHAFCSSCLAQYVAAKLDDNVCPIECPQPGCEGGTVEPESCHGIIPTDLLDKWGLLLCELAVGSKRIYCPYLECSALLLADGEAGAAAIAEAECPHCHRLFCARCAVPWHDGFGCDEFQKIGQDERGREDLSLRRLVGREGWQRCPKCQMFVEKSEGCNYIKCRCGYSFCYRCASELSAQNHYCNKCKR
ncbi:E3 ubiquitin-protein ligase parkin-like [Triticum aestivum]|nr:E3 ubiquitin-protein ligase parkin-like [Triticum aestivum]